jgi:transposase
MQPILGTEAGHELIWTTSDAADPEVRHLYFGLGHFCTYRADDVKSRNILVGLTGAAGLKRKAVAEAFGVNRCLVPRYARAMREEGSDGIMRDGRGRPGKSTPQIEAYVRGEFRKLYRKSRRNFMPKLIGKVKAEYGVEIGRDLMRRIVRPVRAEMDRGSAPACSHAKRTTPRAPASFLPVKAAEAGGNGQGLMRRLETGFYSRYAGGLLLNVFVAKLTEGVFEGERGAYRSFCLMVMEMVQFDVVNLERVKRLHRGEFGLLVGRSESPTLMTMRRQLSEAATHAQAEGMVLELAANYIRHLSPASRTFYVDDHFDPYWGKAEVLQGFSHVYDRPMEGMEHCFVHDAAGNPLFFGLRDGYHSFNEVLPYVGTRLKRLAGPRPGLLMVFDRGGYDRKVFRKLGQMGIGYAVWVKGDKTRYRELGLEYEVEEFEFRRNVPGKPRRVHIGMAELKCEAAETGDPVRKIVLMRRATRRLAKKQPYLYSAFVSNDPQRSKRELTEAMIYRWRQECDFKTQAAEFGLNQITSYTMHSYRQGAHRQIEEFTEQESANKEVANPARKPLRRRKRSLKAQIAKIDEQLGRRAFNGEPLDLRTVSEVAVKRGTAKLLRERTKLVSALHEVVGKMEAVPSKVKKLDLLKEQAVMRFDFRKKLLMDTVKVAARNARRMALGVLDRHYRNYRDQVDFLRRLLRAGGDVKLNGDGRVTVDLTRMNTSAENEVAQAFLDEINELGPTLLGGEPLPLKFRLKG